MCGIRRMILLILATVLLLGLLSAAHASTTVWAVNDYAWRVPHSYKGTDWAGYISYGQSFKLLETKGNYAKLRNAKSNTAWQIWNMFPSPTQMRNVILPEEFSPDSF